MIEPTVFDIVVLASVTVAAIVALVRCMPTVQRYTEGGNYRREKVLNAPGFRYEPAAYVSGHNGFEWVNEDV